jgi:ribonuclease Z
MSERKTNMMYAVWEYSTMLGGFTIRGHSRGSERSGFYIPELNLFLDAGIQSYFNPDYIFITHCHTDHSFALPMILTGINKRPKIYVPEPSCNLFQEYIEATYRLSKGSENAKVKDKIIGVSPGEKIKIKDPYYVQVYKLDHSVPTSGYGIHKMKKKIHPEYANLTGKEIVELKKQGKSISYDVDTPMLVYLCDTTTKVLDDYPEIFDYQNVMIECTFLLNEDEKSKHIQWTDLKPYIIAHPNTQFTLIHFSMRYKTKFIKEFFEKEDIQNVRPWLN